MAAEGEAAAGGWAAVLDRLVAEGAIPASAAERAWSAAAETGEPVDAALTQLGLISERDLAAAAATALGLSVAAPDEYGEVEPGRERISLAFLRRRRLAPLRDDGETLTVAAADPTDREALDALAQATGRRVAAKLGLPSDIAAALDRAAEPSRPAAEAGAAADDVDRLRDLASEAPVIRLANRIIAKAIDLRASDIHLEPVEAGMRVRYRIDGALQDQPPPPAGLEAALVSRIKIIARLDIAERRMPQDGRIGVTHRGQRIDLRVSTLPALAGEAVALRILDRSAIALDLDALMPPGDARARWSGLLERPNGILLMTGPTGSGKTTTLYASLKRIARPDLKILTVEDPVEFALEGALQVQVKSEIGLSFAAALRAFLRHDPDIVMVGEIRDRETAEIAVQAALTGHLVLSTLHTNSAASAVPRLLDMGIEGFLIASVVIGVGAQRLVRTLCPSCRTPYEPPAELVRRFGLDRFADPPRLWRAVGCPDCGGRGFRGRTSVTEVMGMDDALRALVLERADASRLEAAARAAGMAPLLDAGLRLAVEGRTTLEEILRATRAA